MTNLEAEPAPLPPPSPTPRPLGDHRWARSDDRIALGVAGGLGRALAVDPLFVRIAFVVLSLFSGVGILLYIAAIALLADSPTSSTPSIPRRVGGIIGLLLSTRWLFNGDARLPEAGWVVAIGLLGAAVAMWRGTGPSQALPSPPTVDTQSDVDGRATNHWESLSTKQPKQPRPARSPLGVMTIGAATVVGALVWLANQNEGNRGVWAFGWATIVLGAGLMVGTFLGKARWLVLPAIATSVAALVAAALSFAGVALDAHSGDRTEFINAGSTVAGRYRTGVGDFEFFVADYSSDLSTAIDVAVGNLTVVVPDNAEVHIDARVGLGAIDTFGSTRNGYRRALHTDSNGSGSSTITLQLRVGVGNIEVRRGSTFNGSIITLPSPPAIATDIPILKAFGDGTMQFADGSIDFGDGRRIEADGTYQVPIVAQNPDGSVQLDNGAMVQADGSVVSPGGFVIAHPNVIAPTTLPEPSSTTASEVQP